MWDIQGKWKCLVENNDYGEIREPGDLKAAEYREQLEESRLSEVAGAVFKLLVCKHWHRVDLQFSVTARTLMSKPVLNFFFMIWHF